MGEREDKAEEGGREGGRDLEKEMQNQLDYDGAMSRLLRDVLL